MNKMYFFQNDKECKWMLKEIRDNYPKYLHESLSFDQIEPKFKKELKEYSGKKKFYVILDWVQKKSKKNDEVKRGGNPKWLDEIGINTVQSVKNLPENAGIYITGYDSDIVELASAKDKGIPIINNACPWVLRIKKQLLEINSKTHQCIFMIDKEHMVYECYKSIIPKDAIIINPSNYKEMIKKHHNGKAVYLVVYAVFRKKEAARVADYIHANYPNQDNNLYGYKETLCCWVNQGLLEEIEHKTKELDLNEIWVICSSNGDRSTMSVLSEVKESGADSVIIKKESDIPDCIKNKNIGVLVAPIPISSSVKNIINIIKNKYGQSNE